MLSLSLFLFSWCASAVKQRSGNRLLTAVPTHTRSHSHLVTWQTKEEAMQVRAHFRYSGAPFLYFSLSCPVLSCTLLFRVFLFHYLPSEAKCNSALLFLLLLLLLFHCCCCCFTLAWLGLASLHCIVSPSFGKLLHSLASRSAHWQKK